MCQHHDVRSCAGLGPEGDKLAAAPQLVYRGRKPRKVAPATNIELFANVGNNSYNKLRSCGPTRVSSSSSSRLSSANHSRQGRPAACLRRDIRSCGLRPSDLINKHRCHGCPPPDVKYCQCQRDSAVSVSPYPPGNDVHEFDLVVHTHTP